MNIIVTIKTVIIRFISYLFWFLPIKQNKIMFWNFFGKGYGCNSKYICDYIINNDLDFELIWVVSKSDYKFPPKIKPILRYSFMYFYHLATSGILFDNQHKGLSFVKRKGQFLIKTWHATLGLKKIGLDNKNNGFYNIKQLIYNNKITNLMISNCPFISRKFRHVFGYTGKILECGFPRTDILLTNNLKMKNDIKNKLGIDYHKKILLYAPTFRENLSLKYYNIDFEKLSKVLETTTQQEWIILIKLHPHISDKIISSNLPNVFNLSKYDDIQELMMISDILITDYSNIMFEFALTKRPVFLFATDYDEYKKNRDYYFNCDELPFPLAKNNNHLFEQLQNFNMQLYKEKVSVFFNSIGFSEKPNSSELLVNFLKNLINKKEKNEKNCLR